MKSVLDRITDCTLLAIVIAVPGLLIWVVGGLWAASAWVFGLASLWLISKGLSWDPARDRPRCPKCWYSLAGAAADSKCPECGFAPRAPEQLLRTRRNWFLVGGGVAIVLGYLGMLAAAEVRSARFWQRSPAWVIVRLLPYAGDEAWSVAEGRRENWPEQLSAASKGALRAACVEVLRNSSSNRRRASAYHLARDLSHDDQLDLYRIVLDGSDARLRQSALWDLGVLAAEDRAAFAPRLRELLDSDNLGEMEKQAARRALRDLPPGAPPP